MPLAPDKYAQACQLVSDAVDEAAFLRTAGPADIPWSDVSLPQRKDLLSKAKSPAVEKVAKGFCAPVSVREGKEFVSEKMIPRTSNSREFWFKYYLQESAELSDAQRKEVESVLRRVVYKTPDIPPSYEFKVGLSELPDGELAKLLKKLLHAGFIKVPCRDDHLVDASFADMVGSAAVAGSAKVAAVKKYDGEKRWKMHYRSDSRSYELVKSSGGFQPKVRAAEGYAKSLGLREPWHPCNDPDVSQYMWFRKGQKDNCLNTVVSVGSSSEWQTYLTFPLLSDKPPGYTTVQRVLPLHGGKGTAIVNLPLSCCWIYLIVLSDLVSFRTGRFANQKFGAAKFKEVGVGSVPLGNIYGAVKFARIFHDIAPAGGLGQPRQDPKGGEVKTWGKHLDEVGFSAYPIRSVGPPQTAFAYNNLNPEPPGVLELRKKFEEMRKPMVRHLRWSSSGFEAVTPQFDASCGTIAPLTNSAFAGISGQ